MQYHSISGSRVVGESSTPSESAEDRRSIFENRSTKVWLDCGHTLSIRSLVGSGHSFFCRVCKDYSRVDRYEGMMIKKCLQCPDKVFPEDFEMARRKWSNHVEAMKYRDHQAINRVINSDGEWESK